MKKFKIGIFSLVMVSLFSVTSCDDYLDVNIDPNNIPFDQVTPNFIFPGAITTAYRTQGVTLNLYGNLVMNSFAGNSFQFGTPFVDYYTPNINSGFLPGIWDEFFKTTANLDIIDKYPDPTNNFARTKAAAKIMKAYYVGILTDLYGDMPYSEAFKYQQNLSPRYDKGEDIYKASIADLEAARAIIDAGTGVNQGASDIIFAGNMAKWKAFSYNLELRYLLRMSKVTGELATYRDQKLAQIASATFLLENVVANPGYSSTATDKQNPFYAYYYKTATGTDAQQVLLVTASENMAIILNGNNKNDTRANYQKYNGIVDGRRGRIFTLAGATPTTPVTEPQNVEGVRQGATPGQPGATLGKSQSRLGLGLAGGTTVAQGSSRGAMLMSKSEINFMLAEAATRYPGQYTNAVGNFNDGISASFLYLTADAGADATYKAAIASRPGLGILVGSTENKIEAIMTQKWIALTGLNPEQSFFDYSRTGYPFTPLASINQRGKENRLFYPASEFATNGNNVPNIASGDVFTKNTFTPFWNRN